MFITMIIRRTRFRGVTAALLLLVATAAIAVVVVRGGASPAAAAERAAVSLGAEDLHVVVQGRIETGPVVSGSLQPERRAAVGAEVGGVVLATAVEVGQPVTSGALLGRIDDHAIRDAWISAGSAVRAAEQAAATVARNYRRYQALADAGAISEQAVEDARTAAADAERHFAGARAALADAHKQLGKTVLQAPIAGIVSERHINAGDVVQPGAPLFTIVDPASMRLEGSVPAEQLHAVKPGAPVEFRVRGYGAHTFQGNVERVSPTADAATRQVRVFVSIPNAAKTLVGGLFAEGRIVSEAREGLIAPLAALRAAPVREDRTAYVLRVRAQRVEQVVVQLGLRDERNSLIQLVSGVAAGDTLIVGAARTITPGTPVKVVARAAALER